MHPLPEEGIEGVDSLRRDPADSNPAISFTVKELILDLRARVEVYVQRQEVMNNAFAPMLEEHRLLVNRVYALELTSLAKKAVSDARQRLWRVTAGTSGLVAFAALGLAIWRH